MINILTTEGYLADVYIDDFYGVEIPQLADVAFSRMTELFEQLGLGACPTKDQLPNPGGGGYSHKVQIGVCREGSF